MMIQHAWTIMGRGIAVDRETNNLSIFDIVEQMGVLAGPEPRATPSYFHVVTLWYREDPETPERGFGKTEVELPSGETHEVANYEVNVADHQRLRHKTSMFGFPLQGGLAGRYWIKTSRRMNANEDWEEVHRLPLEVSFPAPPDEANEPAEAAN
jgi:hypothetical protein